MKTSRYVSVKVLCPEIGVETSIEVLRYCDLKSSVLVEKTGAEWLASLINANRPVDMDAYLVWTGEKLTWKETEEVLGPNEDGLYDFGSSEQFVLWSDAE